MKRTFVLKIALCAVAVLGVSEFAMAQLDKKHVIQFFAHRGSRFEYPDNENTMYAFRESYKDGARGFETDVRMTKDGDLILSHDESLYRTCGVDVQTEDLADKEGMYVEFEIKTVKGLYTQAMLDVLCDKLYKMAMAKKPASSEYLFTSFDKRALSTMKRLHPDAILMMLKDKPCSPEVLMEAYDMGIKRVGCRMDGTTRKTIKLGHKLGMIVSLWPGSTKEDFFLGAALGSDAMCCDRFSEVSRWAKENLPFIKIKGVAEPQR